jgi:hypothetical protein
MKRIAVLLTAISTVSACAPNPPRDEAPLAPNVEFAESVAPGTLVVMVTDAHSGDRLEGSKVSIVGTAHTALTDVKGLARLVALPPGEHRVRAMRIAYHPRVAAVTVSAAEGAVMMVQLRRAKLVLHSIVVGGPR